jgi:hypothetical protein
VKKLLCVVPALLLFAMIGAPNAHADSYTPTFSCTPPVSSDFGCYFISNGYTAPNVSFPSPTVQVTVDSDIYNVTLSAGDSPTDSYSYLFAEEEGPGTPPNLINSYGSLLIDDLTTGTTNSATNFLGNFTVGDDVGDGTLTFSPLSSATPEPASIVLILLGVGLIFFLTRKRFVMREPSTAWLRGRNSALAANAESFYLPDKSSCHRIHNDSSRAKARGTLSVRKGSSMKKLLCVIPVLLLFCALGARADGILLDSLSDSGSFGGGVNTSVLPPLPIADSLQVSVGACLFNCGTPDLTSPTLNVLALASPIPVQDSLSPIPAGASNVQIFASLAPQVFNIGPSDPNFNAVAGSIENGTANGWRVFLTPMTATGQGVGGAGGGNTQAALPLYADITEFQVIVAPFELINYTEAQQTESDLLAPTYGVTTNIFGIPGQAPPPPPPPVSGATAPEPTPLLLLLFGGGLILAMRKRLGMRTAHTT